jgi:C1A family cysteine protease
MTTRSLGWTPPTLEQQVRALRTAQPEASNAGLFAVKATGYAAIPRQSLPSPVLNQLNCGSCTANAWALALYVAMVKQGMPAFVAARLAIYYGERALEGSTAVDAGAAIADGAAFLASYGVPKESDWPYDVSKFAVAPGPTVSRDAYDGRGKVKVNYHPISSTGKQLISDVGDSVASGFVPVFGCPVTEAFCSSQPNGTIHAPTSSDQIAGGHAEGIVVFDPANERVGVQNSWGGTGEWGDPDPALPPGCWWCGFDYLTSPTYGASDVWLISSLPQGVGQ